MSSCVCALIEKGTSCTRDARLVAVTIMSAPDVCATGCWFAAWAAVSWAVWAEAGTANASTEVPISKAAEMRMRIPPFLSELLRVRDYA